MSSLIGLVTLHLLLDHANGIIQNCDLITKDKYWYLETSESKFEENYCKNQGANYVSIHSYQDIHDIIQLCSACSRYEIYIGIELNTCYNDNKYTLKWSDNSVMNYSLIKWCPGYPTDLCNQPYILFHVNDTATSCIRNQVFDSKRSVICGNPYEC